MQIDRFRRVQELFWEAVERTAAERDRFVEAVCVGDDELRAELERLLKAHDASDDFLVDSAPEGETAGDWVDRYRLIERIGEGGFGVVWIAEQREPITRRVALKVVKPGMDTRDVLARFDLERQAIAMMDHPNIARVLDAGATALGRPYFVMELVHGVQLIEFCDRERLSATSRLELFGQVCHAVQHAHQKGVVHRDLKPSNVLVTIHDGEPVCKVIDFGIAKATERQLVEQTVFTASGRFLGTPEYMAPEQDSESGLDVDTRADVYSLGVLLYELLTGTRPLEISASRARNYEEMMRLIRDVEPQRPSTRVETLGARATSIAGLRATSGRQLGSALRGELDWVVMHALEKDRNRRYQTAIALADDVRRYLHGEPVLAGPPNRLYRTRKFVVRHRRFVAVAAVVVVSVLTGLGIAISGLVEARESRDDAVASAHEARVAARRAEEVSGLLTELLAAASPHAARGASYTVRELLDEFEARVSEDVASSPEVEADLRFVVGKSFAALGLPDRSEPQFERAYELRKRAYGADDMRTFDVLARLGGVAFARQDWGRAREIYERVLAARRRVLGSTHPAVAEIIASLGDVAAGRGDWTSAELLHRESLAMRRETLAPDDRALAEGLNDLGAVLMSLGEQKEAESLYRESLEIMRDAVGPRHPNTLTAEANLAAVMMHNDDLDGAEQAFRTVLVAFREMSGERHPSVAMTLENLAVVLMRQRRFAEAEDLLREALAIWSALHGELSPSTANCLQQLASLQLEQRRPAEAEQTLRNVLAILGQLDLAEDDVRLQWVEEDLRIALRLQGKPADAR